MYAPPIQTYTAGDRIKHQIPGQIDGSIDFEGGASNQYINCGNDLSLNITQDFTLEFWVNLDTNAPTGYWPTIIGKGAENSDDGWRIFQNQNSYDYCRLSIIKY